MRCDLLPQGPGPQAQQILDLEGFSRGPVQCQEGRTLSPNPVLDFSGKLTPPPCHLWATAPQASKLQSNKWLMPAPLFGSCVSTGKVLNLSGLYLPYLHNRSNSSYLKGSL